jgi:hypothetical protein
MRDTQTSVRIAPRSSTTRLRSLRLAAVALGVGLALAAGAARAQDDEDDDKTFEEKIIDGIMTGIGGTNMDNRGIDYRERSPLVVPPKIDLPPPESESHGINAANWPKDPDEARHKAAVAARKNEKYNPREAALPLRPDELSAARKPASTAPSNDPIQPGGASIKRGGLLSPSELGYTGGLMNLFGGNKAETAQFKGEPTRESLVQPPAGYQTPSPSYPYGTGGPPESLNKVENTSAPLPPGKY